MILEDSRTEHGYARLILVDAHREYHIPHPSSKRHTKVELIYDSFEVGEVRSFLGFRDDFEPFPGLDVAYNGYYGPDMSIWLLQGSVEDLGTIYHHFALSLEQGPSGGDDDCYDYWPGAMDMLIAFAKDMKKLTDDDPTWGDYLLTAMSKTVARFGDDPEWNVLWDEIRTVTNTHPV